MFYTVYRITNLIDGKIYIGKHQTKDLNDGYMGSGKHLKRAIAKYGVANFSKEILFQFDDEADMNAKEAELVTEEFCLREDTYNLCVGGRGGFSYMERTGTIHRYTSVTAKHASKKAVERKRELFNDDQWLTQYRSNLSKAQLENPSLGFLGKTHSEEWKQNHSSLMKEKMKGSSNSQFGTMWITNGQENKKIRNIDNIPEGWYKGRCTRSSVGRALA